MDPGATLDAWRERGEHRLDPVRFRFIEALARRASAHHGEARRILDDKLLQLLAAYGEDVEQVRGAPGPSATAKQQDRPDPGPLAGLLDHIARHAVEPAAGDPAAGLSAAPRDLKTLGYFRSTWSRLSADRRLTQSLAAVPENAGPLNSHQLVHRALTLMRELSPEYLHRFMSHVDALLWLDRANAGIASPAAAEASRAEGRRRGARNKAA
ncbi:MULTISPECIES: DUF2894 domain-containing protein [unclassified Variovorax]|uniref:DUF2894 domain-containing protein n=1 Tax=unclassified Variovorax TaxID=663243 RepID=UPI00076D6EE2|nr:MULTISPECIES: DUF2894 domain-containing protein [unclassified Variovorax]KWT98757.1 hypothetical protein APY03_0069 [Variovorax sp. WDL1]PNG56180.1 hypothetical protein CHC07_02595 [Variovorax sp. B4]PNG57604.1 hypothetical protein CHC06_02598 [Variovorax sp. B2]VTV09985.1 hypothetical protein WDL1CHR_01032 [Variovorax sp. WDL1]